MFDAGIKKGLDVFWWEQTDHKPQSPQLGIHLLKLLYVAKHSFHGD